MNNWYIKWKNTNRTTPECAELIAKYGWKYYGIYAGAREIISQHGGAAPVEVVLNQLSITRDELEPLVVTFCYVLLSGLLSEKSLKDDAERQKMISEKRAAAGKKAMEKRWGKKAGKSRPARNSKIGTAPKKSKIADPDLFADQDAKIADNNCYDIYNSNSKSIKEDESSLNTSEKNEIITNVIQAAGAIYVDFYKAETGIEPQRSAAGNKAMRSIAVYFLEQVIKSGRHAPEKYFEKTVDSFRFIFKNLKFWGKYESGRVRLQDINSNLPNIIKNIKTSLNGKSTNHGNGHSPSKFAESLSNIDNAQL